MKFYDLVNLQPDKVEVRYGRKFEDADYCFPIAKKDDTTVTFTRADNKLGIDIASKKPISFVRITWNTPSYCDDAFIYGDNFERTYNTLYWEKFKEGRICTWYMATSDKKDTYAYGVMTGCRSIANWKPSLGSITLELDIRNGSFPVQLGERTLHAIDVVCLQSESGETPFKTMQRFCKVMCPTPRLPKNPVYGSNSWYYIFTRVTQKTMENDVKLLAECTEGLTNRPYCVVDEGWHTLKMDLYKTSHKDPTEISPTKFPDMEGLIKLMQSKDLIPGIWIRPLLGSYFFPKKMRFHPLSILSDCNALDPSVPETLEFVTKEVKKFVGMGFKLIKHDFSTRDITGYFTHEDKQNRMIRYPRIFHDKTRTTAEIILDFYKTIRESAGDDTVIIGCNTVTHLSAGLFELQRTGDDTSPRFWERTLKHGVNALAFRMCQHNTFYAADADCVGYTGVVSWKRNREWLNMLAISGTPLFTSITPSLATPEIKEDLKKAYALASKQEEISIPVDWFETRSPSKWHTETTNKDYEFDLT